MTAKLSTRQSQIAVLIATGKTTREIAEALLLSPRTVETHIQAIFEKLGVRKRVDLTALVVRNMTLAGLSDTRLSA